MRSRLLVVLLLGRRSLLPWRARSQHRRRSSPGGIGIRLVDGAGRLARQPSRPRRTSSSGSHPGRASGAASRSATARARPLRSRSTRPPPAFVAATSRSLPATAKTSSPAGPRSVESVLRLPTAATTALETLTIDVPTERLRRRALRRRLGRGLGAGAAQGASRSSTESGSASISPSAREQQPRANFAIGAVSCCAFVDGRAASSWRQLRNTGARTLDISGYADSLEGPGGPASRAVSASSSSTALAPHRSAPRDRSARQTTARAAHGARASSSEAARMQRDGRLRTSDSRRSRTRCHARRARLNRVSRHNVLGDSCCACWCCSRQPPAAASCCAPRRRLREKPRCRGFSGRAQACKPDSVLGDHPSVQLPGSSAGRLNGTCSPCTGRGLASRRVATTLVGSYPTVSPLPAASPENTPSAVCFLCHCPSAFAASLTGASCPAVSGLSSTPHLRATPRSPGLQRRILPGCRCRFAAPVQGHLALGAAHRRPVVQHELPAHRALERGAAQQREQLLLERPVQGGDVTS